MWDTRTKRWGLSPTSASLGSHQLPVCCHCRIPWACASSLTHCQVLSCILPTTSCTNLGWGLPDLPGSFLGAQWVLHNRAGVRAAAGLCPRVGALGAGVGGLGATFPAAQVGTVCSSIMGCFAFPLAMTRGAAGAHTHLGIMQHTALSSSKRSLHHLSSSHLPSAWEVSAIASPSRSSGDAAKLWGALLEQAQGRARQHAWHGAGEVQRGIPQLGSAGTCQEQTLLLLYLPGPVLAQHGTIWHSTAQHSTAPRLCNTHRDAVPVVLLSLAGKRLLGACPSSSLTTSEQSNTHSIQSTEI